MQGVTVLGWGLLCAVMAQGAPPAEELARFNGTWVQDESKSTFPPAANLKFRRSTSGLFEEIRGPVVQAMVFDGEPHRVPGTTVKIAWWKTGPRSFQRQRFTNGKDVDQTRQLQLSEDGSELTETIESRRNGKSVGRITSVLGRKNGGGGRDLTGEWTMVSSRADTPRLLISKVEGLTLVTTEQGRTMKFRLDGTPVRDPAPAALPGTKLAVRPLEDGALERIVQYGDAPAWKSVFRVSADGQTLEVRSTGLGANATPGQEGIVVYRKKQQ